MPMAAPAATHVHPFQMGGFLAACMDCWRRRDSQHQGSKYWQAKTVCLWAHRAYTKTTYPGMQLATRDMKPFVAA